MTIDWTRVLPVVISIGVIIAVAVLRQYSKTVATIAAVMPINIPLAVAIIYAGTPEAERTTIMTPFTYNLAINLLPTFLFTLVIWRMFAAGYGLWAAILVGYLVWAVSLGLLFIVREWLGF